MALFIFTCTWENFLILPDLWFRGFIKSLCLAAELSRKAESSGGVSKLAVGEMVLSDDVRGDSVLVLLCLVNSWPSVERDLDEEPTVIWKKNPKNSKWRIKHRNKDTKITILQISSYIYYHFKFAFFCFYISLKYIAFPNVACDLLVLPILHF